MARYRCKVCGRTFKAKGRKAGWQGMCTVTWEPSTFTRIRWWHGTPPNAEIHRWYLANHGGTTLWWHNIHKHAVCSENSEMGIRVAHYRNQPEEIRKLLWV